MSSHDSAQAANAGRLIAAAGRQVRIYEEGTGPPLVVIVAGAGDCADSWLPVRHQFAASRRAVSYDRAGIGASDNGAPATVDRYLTELGAVIEAASPQGPVILLGHSLGGLIARPCQQAQPERVNDLILLDSTPGRVADDRGVQAAFLACGIAARLLKLLTPVGSPACSSEPRRCRRSPSSPATRPPSHRHSTSAGWRWSAPASATTRAPSSARSSPPQARAKELLAGSWVGVPLAVIASKAFGDKWVRWQQDIATSSGQSSFTFTGTKSHNIHMRHPDLVVSAVSKLSRHHGLPGDSYHGHVS